jgi:signal peptidase I
MPGRFARLLDFWIHGNSYFNIVAPVDGELKSVKPPVKFLLFNLKQDYRFNDQQYTVWFPPDQLFQRAGYKVSADGDVAVEIDGRNEPARVKAGDPIVRLKVMAGDHLFVDRLTYNFRHPKRGEIIVFETTGIAGLEQGQFYIKRLVATGGEHVQLGADRHLIIDGKRLDASTPHFDNLYSFDTNQPPRENHWSGHVGWNFQRFASAPNGTVDVRPEHFMVMGDNTLNSWDSRYWGDFSRTNVIGKYFFVYWPFSSRFGWNVH